MASEVFNLAILLTLKDAASGGLDRIEAKMRSAGKAGAKLADEYKSLRESLNRDLAIGGIGVAGLGMLYKGVKAAGDFQAVMTDLSSSLAVVGNDGKVNLNALAADMQKAEGIAVRLGNALPGTTANFAEEIQALKQNGLATETIMNGAAEAVAHLAVASNALPKDIAADFAQFGNLFKLKANEFAPAADIFSKIYSSTGQTSGELVEAAKYFQGRAGTLLGIGGLKDAEQITRLFGLMGTQGIRGSMAGTSLTDMMSEYGKAIQPGKKGKSKVDELYSATGIKLNFFDDKGNFAGIDKIFEQMKSFDKLSDKDRSGWLEEIFGLRGMTAANVFLEQGTEGWKKFNAEQNKTISLTDKVAQKSATFNNQMESLEGTLENLGITVFEPMLPGLTSVIGGTNELVGSVQEFAKAHPDLMKWSVELAAYGSSAMVVYAGFKTATTGLKMFQLASQFSRGGGLLGYLDDTARSTTTATTRVAGFTRTLGAAETQATGFGGSLRNLASSSVFKVGVAVIGIAAAEAALTAFAQMVAEQNERTAQFLETAKEVNKQYDRMAGLNLLYNTPGDYGGQKGEFDTQAASILKEISEGNVLKGALHPEQRSWWEFASLPNPFLKVDTNTGKSSSFDPATAKQYWQSKGITKDFQDPNMLARLVDAIQKGGGDANFNSNDIKLLIQALTEATSQTKMQSAMDILQKERGGNSQAIAQQKPLAFLNQPSQFQKIQPSQLPNIFQPTQSKTPFGTAPIIKGFDEATLTGKIVPTITNMFSSLTPEFKAAATQTFSGMQQAGGDWQTSVMRMSQDTGTTSQDLLNFGKTVVDTQQPLSGLVSSTNSAKAGLDSLGFKFANYQIPTPNIQTITIPIPQSQSSTNGQPVGKVGSFAVGGTVKADGFAYIHAGEEIRPANVVKGYQKPERDSPFQQLAALRFDKRESNFSQFRSDNQAFQNSESNFQLLRNDSQTNNSKVNQSKERLVNNEHIPDISAILRASHSPKGAGTTIHYAPVFNITSKGENIKQDIAAELRRAQAEFERFVSKTMDRSFDRE